MCSWALCQRWNSEHVGQRQQRSRWRDAAVDWLGSVWAEGIFAYQTEICCVLKIIKRCMWEIRDKRKKTGTKRRGEKLLKLSLHFSEDGGSCQMYSNRVPYVQHWGEFAIATRWKKGKGSTAIAVAPPSVVLQTLQRKRVIFFFFYINILNSIQI